MVFFFNPYPKNIKYKQKDQKQGNRVFNLQIIHMIFSFIIRILLVSACAEIQFTYA